MLRRSVLPLLIGTFILRATGGAGTIVIGLFLADMTPHVGHVITSLEVGFLSAAFYATELTLAPVMGGFSDRWGRRTFLIIAPVFGITQNALLYFTPTDNALPYLLCLQVLAGISSAMMVPATLGYLADYTARDQSQRMRVMSFFELVTSGGIAVGVVLGGFAWQHFGRFTFTLFACQYGLVVVCMFLTATAAQVIDRGKVSTLFGRYWRIIRTPRLFIFIPAWICVSALAGVWLSSQVTFILSRPGHDKSQLLMGSMHGAAGHGRLSLVLGGYVLFFGLCLLFWAFFLKRVPRLQLMLTSVAGVYIACLALGGMNHRGVGNDWLFWVWIPVLLIGIFAETSFAPAALAYLADISEEAAKDRGLLMGLYSIFLGLGQLLGNGLGGAFAQKWGFDGLVYLTALLGAIALISLLVLYRYEKDRFNRQHQASLE